MISFGSSTPHVAHGSTPRVVVEALIHRGDLLAVELKEARVHGLRTAITVGISSVFLLLAGFSGTFALAAAVWQRNDRGLILTLVTLGYLAISGILAYIAARRLTTWHPFSETVRQFHEDCECVQDIIKESSR
jgi:uncharacterized membrane protein YqjE